MSDLLLLDADVVSFLWKQSPFAEKFREVVDRRQLAISFVTVAELYKWAIRRQWSSERVERLNTLLSGFVIFPYRADLAWSWAKVSAACEQAGRSMDSMDAWIAAIAVHYSIELLTHNVAHFEAPADLCGLKLVRIP